MPRLRALRSHPATLMGAVLLIAALHMLVFDRGLGGDGWAPFATLQSLADDGDLWLEDDHRGVMNGLVGEPGGHLVSQYPPGILLLDAVPFFAGRALDALLPAGLLADGLDLPPAGRVPRGVFFSAAAIVLARNAATLLGLLWTGLALRRLGVPEHPAAAAVALTFFGGPLVFYSLVGMTHAPTFALAALLLLLLVRWREAPGLGLALAAGAVAGTAVLVRYSAIALVPAAMAALPAMPALLPARERRSWSGLLAFGAGLAVPLLPLPFWWHASFGSWTPPPYGGRWEISLASPWNVLFAPVHGLFLFHPALLLAAAGLLWMAGRELARRAPGWGTLGAVWFLAVAVLHGWWSEWANTGGYGQRFLIDALPALALGFAAWLQTDPPDRGVSSRRWGPALAAALFGYVLFLGAVTKLVPAPNPHPWPQRLGEYTALVRRPPGLAAVRDGLAEASFLLRPLLSR